jgi:hypothetical protein
LPLAVADGRQLQRGEEPVVEVLQPLIHGLDRTANEVRRDPLLPSFELPLMKEAQPGRQERDHGRRFVGAGRERRGRARLVVVFQEAGHLVLVVGACVEVLADRPDLLARSRSYSRLSYV